MLPSLVLLMLLTTMTPVLLGSAVPAHENCEEIVVQECNKLKSTGAFPSKPQFISPLDGYVVSDSPVCVGVVVPHRETHHERKFPDREYWDHVLIEGYPENSVLVTAVGRDTTVNVDMMQTSEPECLMGVAAIRDVGTYELHGLLEYRNAEWSQDYRVNWVPYEPVAVGQLPFSLTVHQHQAREDRSPETCSANSLATNELRHCEGSGVPEAQTQSQAQAQVQAPPLCNSGDHSGRWFSKRTLEEKVAHGLLPPLAHSEEDPTLSWGGVSDLFQKVFLPYDCNYRPYTYNEGWQCMAKEYPVVHWFADSNSRRALKKLFTNGTWCGESDPHFSRRECACEDAGELVGGLEEMDKIGHDMLITERNGVTFVIRSLPGLDTEYPIKPPLNWRRWMRYELRNMPKASVVIISVGNWDAAFSRYSKYQTALPEFLSYAREAYESIPVIWRSANYFCCSADSRKAFTRLRVQAYEDFGRSSFLSHFPTYGRIWDVHSLYKGRESDFGSLPSCIASHLHGRSIDVEVQVLFNMLCNSVKD